VPLEISFPFEYPSVPPIIQVVPKNDMGLRATRQVKSDGTATFEWSRFNSIVMILQDLSDAFSNECPVFAKPNPTVINANLNLLTTMNNLLNSDSFPNPNNNSNSNSPVVNRNNPNSNSSSNSPVMNINNYNNPNFSNPQPNPGIENKDLTKKIEDLEADTIKQRKINQILTTTLNDYQRKIEDFKKKIVELEKEKELLNSKNQNQNANQNQNQNQNGNKNPKFVMIEGLGSLIKISHENANDIKLNEDTLSKYEEHLKEQLNEVSDIKVAKFKNQIEELKSQKLCTICMENSNEIVFVPCGHNCVCHDCADLLVDCPLCRQKITQKIKTFQ